MARWKGDVWRASICHSPADRSGSGCGFRRRLLPAHASHFPVRVHPRNPLQTEVLYNKALEYANLGENDTVFDIYCGIGTISLFLAQKAKKVYGIEIVEEAVEAANENAKAIEAELKKQMAEAQIEVKSILDSAEMDANARRDEIINQAKAEAKYRVNAAQIEINQEIKNKQHEIQEMIVNTAFEAASKILEHEVDKDKYLKVVNEIIEGASK